MSTLVTSPEILIVGVATIFFEKVAVMVTKSVCETTLSASVSVKTTVGGVKSTTVILTGKEEVLEPTLACTINS